MNINKILTIGPLIVSTECILAIIIDGDLSIFIVTNKNFWMALETTDF